MISVNEAAATLALLRAGIHPPHVIADLIEERQSALAVLQEIEGAKSRAPRLFNDMEPQLARATEDITRWETRHIGLSTVLDPDYPENLRMVHDRPPLLFVAGDLIATDSRSIAVIGSRRATEHGKARAGEIAEHLVEAGYTVTSGLAAGVDTAAHTATLAARGRTVAVIGTGLAHAYPPQNAALQAEIAREHAVVSQFEPDTPPTKAGFPRRNALMSGLTRATVIVEASHRSGARTQLRHALQHGRPVFLTAELVAAEAWASEAAARPGVHVITTPDEITATVDRLSATEPLIAMGPDTQAG